jgi:methionyl-tRNA formyltransferase
MKIGFIGCVESSLLALNVLLSLKQHNIEVVAVITKDKSTFNADYVNLSGVCKSNDIPCHFEESENKNASMEFMRIYQPDIIYCFGWSYLLENEFIDMAPKGIIGFHPAKLPQNRGRHPIIWALALGLEVTASTFFQMEEGADTGPILSQVDIHISQKDDAKSLYHKILDSMALQIKDFTLALANGTAEFTCQDHSKATNWRKRTRKDGLIDWRMQAADIYNLIRALAKPYPGAEFQYLGELQPVWESKISKELYSRNIEPGTVLNIGDASMIVKTGGNTAIALFNLEINKLPQTGDYL